ncbi:MAG: hypothetical protein A3G93_11485 [Nitrospinae bacterium RIFCSPLOWO2_12_FULL_45_22]|nr:MAG: hypothetical protein A3G93_11485 [Nitrospinae bacterium RIFCSPLOWO2_12_FULL_45_22]
MENLYSFPANQTLLTINNLVASLSLLLSFGLAAVVGIRSLRQKVKKGLVPKYKSEDLVKAA